MLRLRPRSFTPKYHTTCLGLGSFHTNIFTLGKSLLLQPRVQETPPVFIHLPQSCLAPLASNISWMRKQAYTFKVKRLSSQQTFVFPVTVVSFSHALTTYYWVIRHISARSNGHYKGNNCRMIEWLKKAVIGNLPCSLHPVRWGWVWVQGWVRHISCPLRNLQHWLGTTWKEGGETEQTYLGWPGAMVVQLAFLWQGLLDSQTSIILHPTPGT